MLARVLLCLLLFSAAAHAQGAAPVGSDTIVARDGSVYRGQVAEIKPGREVTIVLLDGQARTVPWSEIASTYGPSFPGTVAPPMTVMPTPMTPPMQAEPGLDPTPDPLLVPGPGRARLDIESATDKRISVSVPIEGDQNSGGMVVSSGYGYGFHTVAFNMQRLRRVCMSPCTLYVRPGLFTINTNSGDFGYNSDVDVPAGGTAVKMHTPSRGRAVGGLWLISGGAGLLIGGITFAALAGDFGKHYDIDTHSEVGDSTPYYIGAGVVAAAGAGMIVGGAYMMATNRRGVAEQHDLNRPSAKLHLDVAPALMRNGGMLAASLRF
jgi:hypothetical protein